MGSLQKEEQYGCTRRNTMEVDDDEEEEEQEDEGKGTK